MNFGVAHTDIYMIAVDRIYGVMHPDIDMISGDGSDHSQYSCDEYDVQRYSLSKMVHRVIAELGLHLFLFRPL